VVDEDRRQFERLFHEHYDAVLAYAVVRADVDMAKDAVAQAFLVAWRRRRDLPERPLPWLLGVTRKTLAEQRRSATRRHNLAARLHAVGGGRPDHGGDPAEQVVDADGVITAFLALGERDREVLRLVAWDRLDPADAARVLGCSKATFAVRLSRARRRLATALAAHDAADPPAPTPANCAGLQGRQPRGPAQFEVSDDPFDLFPEPLEAP
jgi:RNA polymerase sigma-70 factor (ECF subfamily)